MLCSWIAAFRPREHLKTVPHHPYDVVLATSTCTHYTPVHTVCNPRLAFFLPSCAGLPMMWFAQQWLSWIMFLPAAAAGALLPWLHVRQQAEQQKECSQGHYISCQVRPCAWEEQFTVMLLFLLCKALSCMQLHAGPPSAPVVFALYGS